MPLFIYSEWNKIDMQEVVKKRPVIDRNGYDLSKKVMRKLIQKEKSA